MSGEKLDLCVGDYIRHLKRGSVYEIIGVAFWARNLKDGDQAKLFFVDGGKGVIVGADIETREAQVLLTLNFQHSIEPALFGIGTENAFIYREVTEGAIYARPTYEFTTDRFAKAAK